MTKARGERRNEIPIGVIDFETDPFKIGRVPFPFAACVYFSRRDFFLLWETDSKQDFITRVVSALRCLPACILYAHNGGRFDFHYLLEFADVGSIEIRNGRVTKMRLGKVTLKDSFPLMPFALEEYRKTPIDYALFERARRNTKANRAKIEAYLMDDCVYLHELLTGFREIVGEKDTIGSAAFYQMRQMGIEIQNMNETHDAMFRPFYFGGRVQAFQKGIFDGPFQYIDINSAYPDAMQENHAHGAEYAHGSTLPRGANLGQCFVRCIADSRGSLPLRAVDGSLSFPHGEFEFCATGWEIAAGIETKTLSIKKIIDVWKPLTFISFAQYVDAFFAKRKHAKKTADAVGALAYKYLLNSGYGKFAQNPRDFREYRLAPYGKNVRGFDWEADYGAISIWSKPSYHGRGFFDVATAASITGYVRAKLWRAVCQSTDVLYIDTDSIICKRSRVPLGGELGQWKLEGDGAHVARAAIAGKKLYGLQWSKSVAGSRYKIASKGARLQWPDLLSICKGESIVWENAAPTFAINGAHFVKRTIQAT